MRIKRANATAIRNRGINPRLRNERGFTVIELTAVVAIIAVLVSLLCAALNRTQSKALRIACLDNLKQLQLAWEMYTDENDGSLPLNQTAIGTGHHRIPSRGNSVDSWVAGNPREDRTSAKIEKGTLFQYVRSVEPFRCPMDDSRVDGHPNIRRTRSYSMNAYLGGDEDLNPAKKFAELRRPANTFVFIEEHENSRWESSFVVIPTVKPGRVSATSTRNSWVSTPSDRHDQGCNLSFADGHIEYWKWFSPKDPDGGKLSSSEASRARDSRDLSRIQNVVGQ